MKNFSITSENQAQVNAVVEHVVNELSNYPLADILFDAFIGSKELATLQNEGTELSSRTSDFLTSVEAMITMIKPFGKLMEA